MSGKTTLPSWSLLVSYSLQVSISCKASVRVVFAAVPDYAHLHNSPKAFELPIEERQLEVRGLLVEAQEAAL